MHVILKRDNPTLDGALPLGGGLTLFGSEEQAEIWKGCVLTAEKREAYRVDEVKVTHKIVSERPDDDDG